MQIYAIKLYNFFRFGEKDNSLVFDLSSEEKESLLRGTTTMDKIYEELKTDPVKKIQQIKKRGIERQIGIVGLIDGDSSSSNGAGKSSIMEGICYAHYDKIVRKTANTDKIEKAGVSVATKIDGEYSSKMQESYVEEYFESGNSIYRLKRGRKFSKTHKSHEPILELECISVDGVESCNSHRTSDTQKSISDVITMDYDVFVNSQMFGQNDAGKYLTGTDKVKKEMLISLLKLEDVVTGCLDLVRKNKNSYDKKVNELKTHILFLEDIFLKTITKYLSESENYAVFKPEFVDVIYNKLLSLLKTGSEKIDQYKSKHIEIQKELDLILKDDKFNSFKRKKDEIQSLKENMISFASESQKKLEKIDREKQSEEGNVFRYSKELNNHQEFIESSHYKMKNIEDEIRQYNKVELMNEKAKISSIKKNLVDLKNNCIEQEKKYENFLEKVSLLQSKKDQLLSEVKSLKLQIADVKEEFVCEKCKSKVSRSHIEQEIKNNSNLIEETDENLKQKKINQKKLKDSILRIKKEIDEINEQILLEAKIDGELSRIDALMSNSKDLKESIEKSKKTINHIQDLIKKSKSKICEINKEVEIENKDLEDKLEKKRIQIATIEESITDQDEYINQLNAKIFDLESKRSKLNEIEQKVSNKIGILQQELESHVDFTKTWREKQTIYNDYNLNLNRYTLLEGFYGLDGIQTKIINKYIPLLNIYIQEYLDILSGKSIQVKTFINDKSKIDMVIHGCSASSYDMLSGGEKMIIRLSVDIGLALLSFSRSSDKPDIICLDEIFGPLDAKHSENVLSMLDNLQDKFGRVLIITHNPEIQKRLKNNIIIEKQSGNFGLSCIKRIE